MKKRSRAHEAGSIEAGSSKSKSIFFSNRVDGAVVGQPGRAKSALGVQSEPARAPRAPRSGRSKPHRTSQGEPEAPGAYKSSQPERPGQGRSQPGRARPLGWTPVTPNRASQDAPGHLAGRPADRAGPKMDSASSNFVMDWNLIGKSKWSATLEGKNEFGFGRKKPRLDPWLDPPWPPRLGEKKEKFIWKQEKKFKKIGAKKFAPWPHLDTSKFFGVKDFFGTCLAYR